MADHTTEMQEVEGFREFRDFQALSEQNPELKHDACQSFRQIRTNCAIKFQTNGKKQCENSAEYWGSKD